MTYRPSFRWRQLQWRAVCEGIIRAGEPKEAINPLRLWVFRGVVFALFVCVGCLELCACRGILLTSFCRIRCETGPPAPDI